MTTFYERYINGDMIKVYEDMNHLKQKAFTPTYWPDVERVLTETFRRTAFNLDVIYKELLVRNYPFKNKFAYNFERPLHPPLARTDTLLDQLNQAVSPFGFVPLSLNYFYKLAGGVNFEWDYESGKPSMWEMADPIQIVSLDAQVEMVTEDDWQENIQNYVDDEDFGEAFLELGGDAFHKDNISGGPMYAIQITKEQSIDGQFFNEHNETTFINYLRICFDHCGFSGIKTADHQNGYQDFFHKVKPQLKAI